VTDNTATNKLVWSTLQQRHPLIFFHGCISHVLHLVVKDLVDHLSWLGNLAADYRKLVRFFKKNQQLWFDLRRLQKMDDKIALVLPAETRWGSIERCFASVLASEKILHAFVDSKGFLRGRTKEQKAKRRNAHDTVVAKDFVKHLEKALAILSVISVFQKAFERNTKPSSDVYQMFQRLPNVYKTVPMTISELGKITQVLNDRFNFVYGEAHGVAYMLDPCFVGSGMDDDPRDQVRQFITLWHGFDKEDACVIELIKLLGGERDQSREARLIGHGELSDLDNWRGLYQFPLLRKIASIVFSASCSSAAAECNFSAHKLVHSQARNRLRDETVQKLVFLFFDSKNIDIDDMAAACSEKEDLNENSDFEYY
jgi:hypothetical protein